MDEIPKEIIHKYIEKLNLRPKKVLGWKTPYEIFFDEGALMKKVPFCLE